MTKRLAVIGGALVLACTASACAKSGQGTTVLSQPGATAPTPPPYTGLQNPVPAGSPEPHVLPPPPAPTINWANLLPDGIPVAMNAGEPSTSIQQSAQTQGQLAFTSAIPPFAATVTAAATSDPKTTPSSARAVEYLFDFGSGNASFPTDGRVAVLERPTDQTDALLKSIASGWTAQSGSSGGTFTTYPLGSGQALLVTGQGTSRVVFILNGVMYDLMGPGMAPDQAQQLAKALYDSL